MEFKKKKNTILFLCLPIWVKENWGLLVGPHKYKYNQPQLYPKSTNWPHSPGSDQTSKPAIILKFWTPGVAGLLTVDYYADLALI